MTEPRRALVIIDLQNEFLSQQGRYPIQDASKQILLSNIPALVHGFRNDGGHIIWVKSIYASPTHTDGGSSPSASPADSLDTRDAFFTGTHIGRTPCCERGSINQEFLPEFSELISNPIPSWLRAGSPHSRKLHSSMISIVLELRISIVAVF